MNDEVFRYGENNRGFGMMSLPADVDNAPVVVIFNSGLIHREGPYRLNVLVCRTLAECGYIAIRVDLSGKGDTPSRENLTNRESVALDWSYIKTAINARFGKRSLTLMGLCSGADNAIKVSAQDMDVKGLILLDPVSQQDTDFYRRALKAKLLNIHKWMNLPINLFRRVLRLLNQKKNSNKLIGNLRDEPTSDDVKNCFTHITKSNGKVLAIFTSHELDRYNQVGQYTKTMEIAGFDKCCEEVFWPLVEHLYPVQVHRDRLVKKIQDWAQRHFSALG